MGLIDDYALIGNGRTAALVSRKGSIDWLCLPRFDSPAVFAGVVDDGRGGRFRLAPSHPYEVERRYIAGTNVLETTFQTAGGVVRVTDFMPVASERSKGEQAWPDHEIIRIAECLAGDVEFDLLFDPRPEYGLRKYRVSDRGRLGVWVEYGPHVLVLRSEAPVRRSGEAMVVGKWRVSAGERIRSSLAYTHAEPAVLPPLGARVDQVQRETTDWWRSWSGACRYSGPFAEHLERSALVLKLLIYAPSGAVVAAPTTSLPESFGGDRNWDYRFCWLRDASWTFRALFDLGYKEEAEAFLGWLLHTTRLTHPRLGILYDITGNPVPDERVLRHLEGYQGHGPVRTGNAAKHQVQLDVYGEVIAAAYEYVRRGGELDQDARSMVGGLGDVLVQRWQEPDAGIWEVRNADRHYTHSKALAWVGLDRLLRLETDGVVEIDRGTISRERARVRAAIESEGLVPDKRSFAGEFGGQEPDAALLQLGLFGFVDPSDPLMRTTVSRVRERLGRGPLLLRYPEGYDGLDGTEGGFLLCSCWEIEALHRMGSTEAAQKQLEDVLAFANDVGLFAEQADPTTGAARGNFPQAYTHVGIISAILALHGGRPR